MKTFNICSLHNDSKVSTQLLPWFESYDAKNVNKFSSPRPRNAALSALLRGRVCVDESEVEKMKVLGFQI